MRSLAMFTAAALLAACRGEPVPRDYRNEPPAMTHPVTTSSGTPTAHGMPGPAPEPSSGAEGGATKPVSPPPDARKTPVPDTRKLPPHAVTTTRTDTNQR
jgi:hypothetical protein